MNEQAKSAALLLLVALSVFLTYQLWFGRKPDHWLTENGYEAVYFEEPRPLSQLLIPERIFVYQAGICCPVRPGDPDFALFWAELSRLLQEIAEPANSAYGESIPEDAAPCLSVQFSPALPIGPESPWLKKAPGGELAEMQIRRSDDRCWGTLINSGGATEHLPLPPGWGLQLAALCDQFDPAGKPSCERLEAGELQISNGARVFLAAPIYVPASNPAMKVPALKAERLDRELLLKTFFIKRNLVREIRERDGGLIYTDGEQGLRLGSGLDYSHPRLEQKPVALSYAVALLTAGKLLGYHGGWPENLRLEYLAREAGTGGIYNARWRCYLQGYPLLGGAGVSMSYHHGGLVSYRRSLYTLIYQSGDAVAVRDYREALAAAMDLLAGGGAEPFTLEKMDLAYYLTGDSLQPQAVPVWVVTLGGRELILKADELIPPEGWKP